MNSANGYREIEIDISLSNIKSSIEELIRRYGYVRDYEDVILTFDTKMLTSPDMGIIPLNLKISKGKSTKERDFKAEEGQVLLRTNGK